MSWLCCSSRKKDTQVVKKMIREEEIESKRDDLSKSVKVPNLPSVELSSKKKVRGLENLGNSCYISAALECLSNTKEFTDYILKGDWRKDVNPANPIGTDGLLLTQYVKLIYQLWEDGSKKAVNPEKFKECLDQVCPTVRFGYLVQRKRPARFSRVPLLHYRQVSRRSEQNYQ
jgi:ubiquitin C-terminal hydrolase